MCFWEKSTGRGDELAPVMWRFRLAGTELDAFCRLRRILKDEVRGAAMSTELRGRFTMQKGRAKAFLEVRMPRMRSGLARREQGRLVDGKVDGMVDVILPRVHGSGCILCMGNIRE